MPKLTYIAGPFRGASAWEVEQNIRHAENVGFHVALGGGIPIIPHTMYRFWDGTQTDRFWLSATLTLLQRCDEILLLVGWEKSKGSVAEYKEAVRLGLTVIHESEL